MTTPCNCLFIRDVALFFFFFSSRRRHTRLQGDWSSDVCSSDLSAQGQIAPVVIAGARGSRIWDDRGNSWLDFASQLVNVNIGHQHPKLVAAIQEQAARLCTIAPFHANDMRGGAARLIGEVAPGDPAMVFF